jgi:hypothetical protein
MEALLVAHLPFSHHDRGVWRSYLLPSCSDVQAFKIGEVAGVGPTGVKHLHLIEIYKWEKRCAAQQVGREYCTTSSIRLSACVKCVGELGSSKQLIV